MEYVTKLIRAYWRTAILVLAGIILIVYIALGFLYFQQGIREKDAQRQIDQIRPVLAKPAPSDAALNAEYEAIIQALTPISDGEAIRLLVNMASEYGINIKEDAGKFRVPAAKYGTEKVGQETYDVMYFQGVFIQGAHSDVMDFLSAIQNGTYLKTMVLRTVSISALDVNFSGEEGERRAEFGKVIEAVTEMMIENGLSEIPEPLSFTEGIATNWMGDNLDTPDIVEGFPDIATTAAEKGYTGNATPRNGYVLYNHALISTENTSQYSIVNYYQAYQTDYYYTCESNGLVRQWSSSDVTIATEFYGDAMSVVETKAVVDIVIFSKK